ncbi:hypothetical protein F5X96DRAFT_66524 [Biscogniauxia mediterranea]|nr:hypothetical protein F5X96DRAFT_66524 [Biscogniauxia mediterranea]
MPPRGYRYLRGPENVKGRPGPRPFPGTRRKRCDLRVPPAKPIQRRVQRHTKKRKVEVLMWLAFQRVPEPRRTGSGPYIATRLKNGMSRPSADEQQRLAELNNPYAILYRPPTYQEAEEFWKISSSTIARWWVYKEKYLTPEIIEKIKDRPIELVGGTPSNPTMTINSPSAAWYAQQGSVSGTAAAPAGSQTVMEISDDSGSDPESDYSDDDEELPDLNTALGGGGDDGGGGGGDSNGDGSANNLQDRAANRGGTEETQEFQDAQEFQQQQQQQQAEDEVEGEDSAVRLLQAY